MKKAEKPNKIPFGQRLSRFIKETFRPREKGDYKEFFTRGLNGEASPKAEYGWMYARVFLLSFVLFAFIVFLISFTENGIAVPTLYLLGGLFMNLPVAVFIYELNPERNLPFIKFIVIMVLGAAAADLIAMLGYYFIIPANDWYSTLWTAFIEEAAKAIPAIIALLFFKKRNPMLGFIIGAAVGAGLSVTEDMGYIYAYSFGVYGMVEIAMERCWTAICTHILWTAVIGWAFCKFKRGLLDIRFWLVFLSSMALHFVWDMPVDLIIAIPCTAACAIIALAFSIVIVKKERKPYLEAAASNEVQLVIPVTQSGESYNKSRAAWFSHTANYIGIIALLLTGALIIAWCYVPVGENVTDKRFKDEQSFIEYVQGGKTFNYDWEREFDEALPPSAYDDYVQYDGRVYRASQKVADGDYTYIYNYYFSYTRIDESEEVKQKVELGAIQVVINDEYYYINKINIGDETLSVVEVNVSYTYYDAETNEYVVVLNYEADHTAELVVSATALIIFILGGVVFTAFKIKSKKLRRKENVG